MSPSAKAEPVARGASNTWSTVTVIHDPLATDAFQPRRDRLKPMLLRGLTNLTSKPNLKEAWLSLVSTKDVIGLKVFAAPGLAGTRPEVVAALAETLIDAGIPKNQIVIWDKLGTDLQAAGFVDLAKSLGIRCQGSYETGYDEAVAYTNSFIGHLAWTDREFNQVGETVGKRSFFTKLVTKELTKIVNVAPLLNHYRAGVVGCLYSLAIGSVDNTQRFENNAERLAEAVPEIYAQEPLLDKVALNVVDALLAQYQGENFTMLQYTTALNELRFSRDPLALDVLSLKDLEALRKQHHVVYTTNSVTASYQKLYNENAPLLELGTAQTASIKVERR